MEIRRTWKSDGSSNVMLLDVASMNLIRNMMDQTSRKAGGAFIRRQLKAGARFETPLAVFCRADLPGEALLRDAS